MPGGGGGGGGGGEGGVVIFIQHMFRYTQYIKLDFHRLKIIHLQQNVFTDSCQLHQFVIPQMLLGTLCMMKSSKSAVNLWNSLKSSDRTLTYADSYALFKKNLDHLCCTMVPELTTINMLS